MKLILPTFLFFLFLNQGKASLMEYHMCFTTPCISGSSNCTNAYYHEIAFFNDSMAKYTIIQVSEVRFSFNYKSIDTLTVFGTYHLMKNKVLIQIDDYRISSFLNFNTHCGIQFIISGVYQIKSDGLKMKSNQASIFANQMIFIGKTAKRKAKCIKIHMNDDCDEDMHVCLNTCWFWDQISRK